LLFRHLIVGGDLVVFGGGAENISSTVATGSIGYRHCYFTLQGSYGISTNGFNYQNTWEVSASINLRNKDNRNLVTDFEKW